MEILSSIWSIVLVACGFGLLMFIHELGHFLAARRFGIPVEAFSLGIGPALLKYQRGETLYTIRPFPFFAYVLLSGMDPDNENFNDPKGFNRQPWYAKAIVLVAGAAFNFVLAILLFAMLGIGWGFGSPQLADVRPGLPAYKAGLRQGDLLLSINGVPLTSSAEVQPTVQAGLSGGLKPINIRYQRDGERGTAQLTPEERRTLEISLSDYKPNMIRMVRSGGVMDLVGVKPGDLLLSVDGQTVEGDYSLDEALNTPGQAGPVKVVVESEGEERTLTVTPSETFMMGVSVVEATTGRISDVLDRQVNHITGIAPGSPAELSGLKNNDRLIAVTMKDGEQTVDVTTNPFEGDIEALSAALKDGDALGKPVELLVSRRGEEVTVTHTFEEVEGEAQLGFRFFVFLSESGLKTNDVIRAIDGKPVEYGYISIDQHLRGMEGRPVEIEIERGGEILTLRHTFTFENGKPILDDIGFFKRMEKPGPIDSLKAGWNKSKSLFVMILQFLGKLFTSGEGAKDLGGPVAIIGVSYQAAKTSIYRLIDFLVMLNVNLAIVNLLPLPALDGGRIVFVLHNAIWPRGLRIPPRVENVLHTVGFMALLGLALLITVGDFQKLDMILGR